MKLTGLVSATYTPFEPESGRVDPGLIGAMADFMIRSGNSGFYVCGSTGEGESLSPEERKIVAEAFVKAADGRIPVVVQVGHNSLAVSKDLAAHAAAIGADAISSVPPGYFKPSTPALLVDFLAEVAASAPALPYYYYHIPKLTGVQFDMPDFLRAASKRIPTLNGIKFSDFFLAEMMACQEVDGRPFDILFGSDEMLLGALACGAKGAVGSCYGFAAPLWLNIISAHEAGQQEEALRWMKKAARLVRTIFSTGSFQACVKQVVWPLLGFSPGPLRLPQPTLSPQQEKAALRKLEESGFAEELASGSFRVS